MAGKSVDEMVAQVLANLKTGYQCTHYPQPSSNFDKVKMDASKAAGIGKPLPPPKKGKVKLGGKVI